jgi:hypothetical protein
VLSASLDRTSMRNHYYVFFFIFLLTNCGGANNPKGYYIETESHYDTVDGISKLSGQILRLRRKSDNLIFTETTKINNYNDDMKLLLVTGISKKDGLKVFSLDSIFYDERGNDTLKLTYIFIKDKWNLRQYTIKKFRSDNQIFYFRTERIDDSSGFQKNIFYSYDNQNRLIAETEYECLKPRDCDSTIKKRHFYSLSNKTDSIQLFYWKNQRWEYRRTYDRTNNGR